MRQVVELTSVATLLVHLERSCSGGGYLFRGQPVGKRLNPRLGRLAHASEHPPERAMLQEFKRRALPYLPHEPSNDWEWLALAQHHGMATRFLDWTANPLAGLWFAVTCPAHAEAGALWVFRTEQQDYVTDVEELDPLDLDRTHVFQPRHITPRIVAQSGWFTVHKYLRGKKRFVWLDLNTRYQDALLEIRVPPSAFGSILVELDRCGVNVTTLFPDLDGVARHVDWCLTALPEPDRGP
jgi:hypothetical protein